MSSPTIVNGMAERYIEKDESSSQFVELFCGRADSHEVGESLHMQAQNNRFAVVAGVTLVIGH